MDTIKLNLEDIRNRIAQAAEKSGRKAEDITLVGVTKTIDPQRIQQLVDLGVTNLGENKVQEICEKHPVITGNPSWHMIGHLQTNKVRQVIDKVTMIHSVDSLRLAQEIEKRAEMMGLVVPVLLEVNMGGEETKSGVSENETYALAKSVAEMPHVCLKGLMTVAPFVENQEKNRNLFRKMRNLFIDIRGKFDHNSSITFLSMGMTNDYEVAIEEGANIVRIGTGLFGARYYG